MTDELVILLLWSSLAAHTAVAIAVRRQTLAFAWIPAMNGLVSGAIVVYWLQKWYGYLFQGIHCHLTDQWIPVYGLTALLVSVSYFLDHNPGDWLQRMLFGLHVLVLLLAGAFFTTFTMDRLF